MPHRTRHHETETLPHHGLNVDRNPCVADETSGGLPRQQQPWPGSDRELRPLADHGEHSYKGGHKLRGLRALITGGDSGIGRAVAIAFAREGADVAISYYDEHDDAHDTVEWIEREGRQALSMAGDLRNLGHCQRLIQRTVDAFGGLDILVNNAAVHFEQPDFRDISPEQIDQTFRTNLFAPMWLTQAALPYLNAGDVIINCGSIVANVAHPTLMDYAATKVALHHFTRGLALSLAPQGIRVNCVAPGPVWTPLIASTRTEDSVAEFGSDSVWNRPAQPAEIAPSFVFLASTDARFYTGEVLYPSGMIP